MKNIAIIIPCYKAQKSLADVLHTIAVQSIKDECQVYICNDCDSLSYDDILSQFKGTLDITYLVLPFNKGAGQARQFGIDNSTEPYIVFIDSDDVFTSPFALENLYQTIVRNDLDIVSGDFTEEIRQNGELVEVIHGDNTTWLHGKIFKRAFMVENNLRFEDYRLNEDVYLLSLMRVLTNKTLHIHNNVYCWRNNQDSLVRNISDNETRYKLLLSYISIQVGLYLEKERRCIANEGLSLQQSVDALIMIYFYFIEIYYAYGEEFGSKYLEYAKEFYQIVWDEVKYICKNDYLMERYSLILGSEDGFKRNIPIITLYDFVSTLKKLAGDNNA